MRFISILSLFTFFMLCCCGNTRENNIKVTCGESVFTCRTFTRNRRLEHYTCRKGEGNYIEIPLTVGDSCKVEDL
jgi:hypothetical protein